MAVLSVSVEVAATHPGSAKDSVSCGPKRERLATHGVGWLREFGMRESDEGVRNDGGAISSNEREVGQP